MENAWIVARVATGCERIVQERLFKRHRVASYCPRFIKCIIDKRTHRRRWLETPLFPCYVFVRSRDGRFYHVLDVNGVTRVVMEGERPAMSSGLDRAVAKMRSTERDGFVPPPVVELLSSYKTGDKVQVTRGVLKDRVGVFQTQNDRHVIVLMDFFGRKLEVNYSELDVVATA